MANEKLAQAMAGPQGLYWWQNPGWNQEFPDYYPTSPYSNRPPLPKDWDWNKGIQYDSATNSWIPIPPQPTLQDALDELAKIYAPYKEPKSETYMSPERSPSFKDVWDLRRFIHPPVHPYPIEQHYFSAPLYTGQ